MESAVGTRQPELRPRTSHTSSAPDRLRASEIVFLGVLVTLGAALRFYRLDAPLWYDEIVTVVEVARAPLLEIVSQFPGDNHHPLYSVLAHLSIVAFGEHPWALRLPSALFGIAGIAMLYVLGRQVTNRLEASAAALILTVSYHHVWFSQNARGYTVLLFVVMLSTYALLRWFATGRPSFLVLYAVSTALGAYAHLTMVLVAFGQAAVCIIPWTGEQANTGSRTRLAQAASAFTAAGVLTALLYAPMLLDVGAVLTSGQASGNAEKTQLSWTLGAVIRGLRAGVGNLWAIAVGGVIFLAGIWSYFRQHARAALVFALPVFVTVAAALLLNRPLRPRFMFFAAGFALLFTVRGAAAVGTVAQRLLLSRTPAYPLASVMVVLLTAAAVGLSVRSLPYGYRFPKQDYVEAVTFVERTKGSEDPVAVVSDGGAIPILGYLGRPWQRIDTGKELRALQQRAQTVWVVSTFPSYIEAGQPDLWAMLQGECTVMHEVEGTLEDGTITIRRCP